MEGTKNFSKFLEDMSKGVRCCCSSCCSSAYMFIKKSTLSEENFNAYAKILITHILCIRTTSEAYLEPSRTATMELYYKKKPSAIFSKTLYPRFSTGL